MENSNNLYVTIVGEIENFPAVTRKQGYWMMLGRVNMRYEENVAKKFILTDDNRIYGVLSSTDNIMKILLSIKNEFYPLNIRFGIGIGEVVEDLKSDVPTCELALTALNEVKLSKSKKECATTDVVMKINGGESVIELAINTLCKSVFLLEQNWTAKQRQVIHLMIFDDMTQISIANEYGVSASNVQQMLKNGNYFTYRETIENVDILLKEVLKTVLN